jgi:WD40 repeat protein/serine/threonine protein kinase
VSHGGTDAGTFGLNQPKALTPMPASIQQDGYFSSKFPDSWNEGDLIMDAYEVRGRLGEGGFGAVYQVHHKAWNMDLAVKRALKLDEANKQDFINEAQHWIDLGLHPHIISCYFVRNIDGFPHTFAELAEGGSLSDWIQENKGNLYEGDHQQILSKIMDIAIQFAWGLGFAHQQGLVHQDVKPQNALMTPDGVLKVTDFGLAKAKDMAPGDSGINEGADIFVSVGGYTLAYRSPEQAQRKKLSYKTDMWSWGVSVLEMFNGGISWKAGDLAAYALESYLQRGNDEEDIPPIPQPLADLLRGCFREEPLDRPKDMHSIVGQLITIYQDEIGTHYPREAPKPADLRADSLNNKALSMLEMGRIDEAVNNWQEALKIQPHHPEATYNLGLFHWKEAQVTDQEFVQQLEAVIRTKPKEWRGYYLLGKIHQYREDPEGAKNAIQRALEMAPHMNQIGDVAGKVDESNSLKYLSVLGKHENHVNGLAVSQDGCLAISGGRDQIVKIWNLRTLQQINVLEGHQDEVTCVALSVDGSLVGSGSASYEKMVKVWDSACGKLRYSLEDHTGFISDVAFTPDGRKLLSCSSVDNTLRLWDLELGICQSVFEDSSSIECVTITPDGRTALTGNEDGDIRFWDLDTGKPQRIIHAHEKILHLLRITPDGAWIISGSWEDPIKVWDLATGTCLRHLLGQKRKPAAFDISDDGQWCISIDDDKILRIWDMYTGICRRTESLGDNAYQIAYIPGRQLLLAYHQDLHIWRFPEFRKLIPEWEIVRPKTAEETVETLSKKSVILDRAQAFLSTGKFNFAGEVVTQGLADSELEHDPDLLDILHLAGQKAGTRTRLRMVHEKLALKGEVEFNYIIRFTPDDRQIIAAAGTDLLHVWDLASGECINQIWTGYQTQVLEIDPTGQFMVVGDEMGQIEKRSVQTGELIHSFESYSFSQGIDFSITRDGKFLVINNEYDPLGVWYFDEGTHLRDISEAGSLRNFALLPQKYRAVALGYDNQMQVWDLLKGVCLRSIELPQHTNNSLVVSPDGCHVIIKNSESILNLWELASGKCLQVFEGHTGTIYAAEFLPDGLHFISIGEDNTLRIWDIESGKCIRNMQDQVNSTMRLVFSPDGKFALTTGLENSINLWDLITGDLHQRLEGHNDIIYALEMDSTGRFVATGSGDEKIKIWQLDWNYYFPEQVDWDNGARPYLQNFLMLHKPYGPDGITSHGKPKWDEAEFQIFLRSLGRFGYGWLKEEGVRRKLVEMAEKDDYQ